jgi:hypothetical protein
MDDVDDDVAAAMGFSSFGGTKKRKLDHTNSPKAKVDASGANTTQLGVRPKVVAEDEGAEFNAATETVEAIEATDPAGNASQSESHPPASNTKPNPKGKRKQNQPAVTGLAAFLSRGQTLPENPPPVDATPAAISAVQDDPAASELISFGGAPISRAELNALRTGVRDDNGDTAYFLTSFLEDPWERMKGRR